MYEEISAALAHAAEGMNRYNKIENMLEDLHKRELELTQRCRQLETELAKQHKDVEKITGVSLVSIFASLCGNRQACLDQEQREALAAELKLSQCQSELEDLRHHVEQMSKERDKLKGSGAEYQKLYNEKLQLIQADGSDNAKHIMNLSQTIAKENSSLKEIREAVSAGQNVIGSLESIESSLATASNWGVYDMLGGGLVADLAKHSHIDDARIRAENTQRLLGRFRTELADVKISSVLNVNMDGFAKFADFFFDSLIADWFMQSKINDSRESVLRVKSEVQQTLWKLGDMLCATEKSKETAEKTLNELVTTTK